jgi:hypothetical protein
MKIDKEDKEISLLWWCMPIISELRRLKKEVGEIRASLCYTASSNLAWLHSDTLCVKKMKINK